MNDSEFSATRILFLAATALAVVVACEQASTLAANGGFSRKLLNADRDSEAWSPPRYAATAEPVQPTASKPLAAVSPNTQSMLPIGLDFDPIPSVIKPNASQVVPPIAVPAEKPQRTTNSLTPVPESAPTYKAAKQDLDSQLGPSVQHGFGLARRGALFAARLEFLHVLRRTADAKDIESGGNEHSVALAAGLRALDESEDFVPRGSAVEAELDMRIAASSHRTPILGDHPEKTSPRDAIALYHRYAQEQLGHAVAGEQVGSMALYGLGKIATRWSETNKADAISARTQISMYGAAVAACPENHLAANELGVCLCRNGRADEATRLFEQAIKRLPNSTAYHNLAVAQQKLGMTSQAAANEQVSQRLAASERAAGAAAREVGVEWLSPAEMSGMAQSTEFPIGPIRGDAPATSSPTPVVVGEAPSNSKWQKVVQLAKSLPLVGSGRNTDAAPPSAVKPVIARLPDLKEQSTSR